MSRTNLIHALILGFLVTLSGCASFEKENLARMDAMPDVSSYKHKPSAYIDFSFYHGKPDENPKEMAQVKEKIQPVISDAVDMTQLFSGYTFNSDQAKNSDYTIKVKIYNHGDEAAAMASGFITGFTLFIIPGAATDNYTVVAEAMDKQGRILGKSMNDDAIKTWLGVWFLPMMGHTPDKAMSNTLKNQVVTALVDLFDKKIFRYSSINDSRFSYTHMVKKDL